MPNYLFIFTIGPVQSFIAQARKTQDLYAGSQLLSDLIKYAFNEARNKCQSFQLIFPFENAASMPNRFVALLTPIKDIKKFGDELEEVVMEQLLRIAENEMSRTLFEKAKLQIADFLESYWAAIPYDFKSSGLDDEGKTYYQQRIGELERVLGGVKNFRKYHQFTEEPARKCSVNGYYNALFYRRTIDEIKYDTDPCFTKHVLKEAVLKNDNSGIGFSQLDSGEGICGLIMLRRSYKKEEWFPSTAGIALKHILDEFGDSYALKQLAQKLGEDLRTFNHQFLYSENIESKDFWIKQGKSIDNFQQANDLYKLFRDMVREKTLLKYYAVIVFDADNMGEHFSNCSSSEEHTQLSQSLSEYANWAKEFVDNGHGKTVYAGGDDYVGMLNLTTLFETIEKLRTDFDKRFSDKGITFSAGITVAHYKTPLAEVLNYARKMEKKAKDHDGKNAFGIVIMKHSGEILETVLPWQNSKLSIDNENYWNTSCLINILNSLNKGVSSAFIKNLHDELTIWENKPAEYREQSKYEIARNLKRSSGSNDVENTITAIQGLYALVDQEKSNQNFISTLNIIDFLNRKV